MKCLIFIAVLSSFSSLLMGVSPVNERPIIGILTEAVDNSSYAPNATSYMMASYVKFIESAGARVVPIMRYQPRTYYEGLLHKINGVLLPGGDKIRGYTSTSKIIYDIAVQMNEKGNYFPLWGICLGFEVLNFLAANETLWMNACKAKDLAANINLMKDYKDSRMFKDLDVSLASIMQSKNVTVHYHHWCLTPQKYAQSGLDKFFKVLAVNQDAKNVTFVSIIEAYRYPFYGLAFHPEKVMFEWILSETHRNIPHSADAIKVSQYFSNFLVNEARNSTHHFPSKEMEDSALIYNYNPIFTGKYGSASTQNYYFT